MAPEIKTVLFNDLDTRVKEHVCKFMQDCIEQALGAFTLPKQVTGMLDQVNPKILFILHPDGRKEMQIDESDERISKFLFESYQAQAAKDPDLIAKIIRESTMRVDGTDRMRIK